MRRVKRFFFMHIGTIVAVIVYFNLADRAGYSVPGIAHALRVALVVMSCYAALAYSQGELKQFDFGIWTMFALGALFVSAGVGPVTWLFQHYSPAILFGTFTVTALVPLVAGRETFTVYYARRQLPAWQLKLPEVAAVSRVMTAYWVLIFLTATTLCAWQPRDPRFTLFYPNLLVFVVGMTATFWLPALYFRLFPPGVPQAVEPLVMGMPMVFDRKGAGDARAVIQFCVSGAEPGDYHVRIERGRCKSFEGVAPTADLTIYTPGAVWTRIARGELDGGQALAEGLYRVEGDFSILAKMEAWFPARRGAS